MACSNNSEKIANLSQVDGKRICVLTGSAGDISARSNFPNAKFYDMVGSADAALAVKTGKADAFVYDKGVLLKIVEKNPELIILDQPVSKLDVAVALNKENNELQTLINQVLRELKENGTLASLKKKWVDTKYLTPPVIDAQKAGSYNGTLKLGTSAIYEPFTFQSNGKFTGIDIELSMIIGAKLGKKIEIVDMNFDGLIPALQSGKIDFALSNFNVTEERKKSIIYSEPYISNDISVLVKK